MDNKFVKFIKKYPIAIIVTTIIVIALACVLTFFLVNMQLPSDEHKILLSDETMSEISAIKIDNMVPGDSVDYIYVISNNAKVALNGEMKIIAKENIELAKHVKVSVVIDNVQIFNGSIESLFLEPLSIGELERDGILRLTITFYMDSDVGNDAQGGKVDFDIEFKYIDTINSNI